MSVKIKTISGSVYDIDDHGICRKYNKTGLVIDTFKVYVMKAVPTNIETLEDLVNVPLGKPEVGKLFYVAGRESDWLSTEVVSIEGTFED